VNTLLVTGGAGFIGSNLVRMILRDRADHVVVLDALTYAGNLENLADCVDDPRCTFVHGDITNAATVEEVMSRFTIDGILHLAAESHVDRSIASAAPFIHTNVTGTLTLLEAARSHNVSRFLHVSTDEVYGTLSPTDPPFTEHTPLDPTSPYSASKAASDLLVRAFVKTYGLDAVITRCSNNYGPYQFPEKFIPLMVLNAQEGRPLPIYGDGRQVRDWLHVDDHCRGLLLAYDHGRSGEVYNFGGFGERTNIDVATRILDEVGADRSLLEHVTDRLAHDRRYAIDPHKVVTELGWQPQIEFETGLAATIRWYAEHRAWADHVRSGEYRTYYQRHYNSSL
jgi:dTDP-glucose 4,6-dehydratase